MVDRCADPKKCIAPSHSSHDVKNHLDLGPMTKAQEELGDKLNYKISWKWSTSSYTPRAYITGNSDPNYYRIGLMMPKGVSKIEVEGQTWIHNVSQSEFKKEGELPSGLGDKIKKGLTIKIFDGGGKSLGDYKVQSDLTDPLYHDGEKIYKASLSKQ